MLYIGEHIIRSDHFTHLSISEPARNGHSEPNGHFSKNKFKWILKKHKKWLDYSISL